MIPSSIVKLIPKRSLNASKKDVGRLGVIAGSNSMMGAAIMVCLAAYRAGVGMVYLVTDNPRMVNIQHPEIICLSVDRNKEALGVQDADTIRKWASEFSWDAMVVGPGLGRHSDTQFLVHHLVTQLDLPKVIDADGLFALGTLSQNSIFKSLSVLTPHEGEFSRLSGIPISTVQANRASVLSSFKTNDAVTTVLKGHQTLVSDGTQIFENITGNSGMAVAGMGDVLSGVIGAFLSQGLSPFDAACLAVYLHGQAGDECASIWGVGVMPTDVIGQLPKTLKRLGA